MLNREVKLTLEFNDKHRKLRFTNCNFYSLTVIFSVFFGNETEQKRLLKMYLIQSIILWRSKYSRTL